MKSLQQHIEEKLIINRNFNSADYELPKDDGYCLRVGYPYGKSPHLVKRISLEYIYYDKQIKNDVECIYLGHKKIMNAINLLKAYFIIQINRGFLYYFLVIQLKILLILLLRILMLNLILNIMFHH